MVPRPVPFIARVAAACVIGSALTAPSSTALADGSPEVRATASALAPILSQVARHASQLEEMKRRGSFNLDAHIEKLDGDGHVSETNEVAMRITATPAQRITEIVKYTENGVDKTADARKKAAEQKSDGKKEKRTFRLPFLASEQARYTFALAERSARHPGHVRVTFHALVPAEDAYNGSAWIDEDSGEVMTVGFTLSKNPMFVDHVDLTVRFDLPTPLGRAPSSLSAEIRGGIPFFRKHLRVAATVSNPTIGF